MLRIPPQFGDSESAPLILRVHLGATLFGLLESGPWCDVPADWRAALEQGQSHLTKSWSQHGQDCSSEKKRTKNSAKEHFTISLQPRVLIPGSHEQHLPSVLSLQVVSS